MKYPICIILICIFTSVSSTSFCQMMSLGIKTGVGISMLSIFQSGKHQPNSDIHPLISPNGGLTLNVKISERWCFHSEIIFEDKGHRVIEHVDSIPERKIYDATWKSGWHNYYLQFPQTIRYQVPVSKRNNISMYFELGGYFAYYIITREVARLYYNNSSEKSISYYNEVDNHDTFVVHHRFDWGATIGTGLLFPVWKGLMDINFKYDQMIQPFAYLELNSKKAYYSVVGITIGYSLPVLKKDYH